MMKLYNSSDDDDSDDDDSDDDADGDNDDDGNVDKYDICDDDDWAEHLF